MSIKDKLEEVATNRNKHLLQFFITNRQARVLKIVARHWSKPGDSLSVSELCRRCIKLALAKIEDRSLLAKIRGIMTTEEDDI
jgi:hypothetical protein